MFYSEEAEMVEMFRKGNDIVRLMFYINHPDDQRESALLEVKIISKAGQQFWQIVRPVWIKEYGSEEGRRDATIFSKKEMEIND